MPVCPLWAFVPSSRVKFTFTLIPHFGFSRTREWALQRNTHTRSGPNHYTEWGWLNDEYKCLVQAARRENGRDPWCFCQQAAHYRALGRQNSDGPTIIIIIIIIMNVTGCTDVGWIPAQDSFQWWAFVYTVMNSILCIVFALFSLFVKI